MIIKRFHESISSSKDITDDDIHAIEDIFVDLVDEEVCRNVNISSLHINATNIGKVEGLVCSLFDDSREFYLDYEDSREILEFLIDRLVKIEIPIIDSSKERELEGYFKKCESLLDISYVRDDYEVDTYIFIKNKIQSRKDLLPIMWRHLSKDVVLESTNELDEMTNEDISSLEEIFCDLVDRGVFVSVKVSHLKSRRVGFLDRVLSGKFPVFAEFFEGEKICFREPRGIEGELEINVDDVDGINYMIRKNIAVVDIIYSYGPPFPKNPIEDIDPLIIKSCKYLQFDYGTMQFGNKMEIYFLKNRDKIEDWIKRSVSPVVSIERRFESIKSFEDHTMEFPNSKDFSDIHEIFLDLVDSGEAYQVKCCSYAENEYPFNLSSTVGYLNTPNLSSALRSQSRSGRGDYLMKSLRMIYSNLLFVCIDSKNLFSDEKLDPYFKKVQKYTNFSYIKSSAYLIDEGENRSLLVFIKNKKLIEDIINKINFRQ